MPKPGARRRSAPAHRRRLLFEPLEDRSLLAALITVNSTLNTDARDSFLTLREAILINNRTLAVASLTPTEQSFVSGTPTSADTDTINFNIPGSGVKTISPASGLPTITDPVVIDGYTQAGASANTSGFGQALNTVLRIELNGVGAGAISNGLTISAGGSTVRGLAINRFGNDGIWLNTNGSNSITGNFIGMDVTGKSPLPNGGHGVEVNGNGNTIGGTTPGARNLISGNALDGVFLNGVNGNTVTSASGNSIQGNYIGTDSTGAVVDPDGTPSSGDELGNGISGIEASLAPNNLIGGIAAGAGNIIAGNGQSGISVPGDEVGETIQGNFIGTNPAGAKLGNHFLGITIGTNCIVGGTVAGAGNVIGNNSFVGINIGGPGNIVQGNFVGTNSAGAVLPNTSDGISISSSGNTIGGATAGAGNVIANNRRNGITVFTNVGPATQNAILGNSISANLFLGIDLASAVVNGVTPNDSEDPDTGANNLQNFPEVSGVTVDGTTVRGQYVVPSTAANSAYPLRIEFFKADAGGQQGQTFLGFDTYTAADANASKTFAFTSGAAVAVAQKLVATATDSNGNTSEFSANVALQAPACSTVVVNTNDTGAGSLRDAITCANTTAGVDIVSFNIPGSGVHTISPTTSLPSITDPVIIDGYTQPGASANTNGPGQADNAVILVELNGASAGIATHGLLLSNVSDSTIRGLAINRFGQDGIHITDGSNNKIEGNFIGTNATGTSASPNAFYGVSIFSTILATSPVANNVIGGSSPAARNVISGNTFSGIDLLGLSSQFVVQNTIIQGNFIGTNAAGTAALGNSLGINVERKTTNTLIGGSGAGQGNLISGNRFDGIDLGGGQNTCSGAGSGPGPSSGNVVQGNKIGTDLTGTLPLGNVMNGITAGFPFPSLNTIGGTAAGEGNIIAFNSLSGVSILDSHTAILSNSIFSNAQLGINLGPGCAVTPNDANDADTGPNNLQNFPEFNSATLSGGQLTILYRVLSTTTNSGYPLRVEFFNADADGQEGQSFLGFDTYTAAEAGAAKTFSFTPAVTVAIGNKLVATATDNSNNTSEFSLSFTVTPVTPFVQGTIFNDLNEDGVFEPDAGETPIAGRTVYVDLNNNGLLDSATEPSQVTGGDGRYSFSDLPTGRVRISEVAPSNWKQTAPLGPPNLLVTIDNQIREYTRDGDLVQTITVPRPVVGSQFWKVFDVTVDQLGRIYVFQGDFNEAYISTYTPQTNQWEHHTRPGLIATQDSGGNEISIGDGFLYYRLTRFNVKDWTSQVFTLPPSLVFRGLDDVRIGVNGKLYGWPNGSPADLLYEFDPNTFALLHQLPLKGQNGLGIHMTSVAVTAEGDIFAAATISGPIYHYDANGVLKGFGSLQRDAFDLDLSADGYLAQGNRFGNVGSIRTDFAGARVFTAGSSQTFVAFATYQGNGQSPISHFVQLSDRDVMTGLDFGGVTTGNEAPHITSDGGEGTASISVAENATAVTDVDATDPDAGSTLTYSISGGADAAKFAINSTTGVLTFINAPDFETPTDAGGNNVYDSVVRVSDGNLSDTQAIAVTVTDVSETCSTIVVNTNDSGPGSFREAINCANNTPNIDRTGDIVVDPDPITFNIPGSGVKTISPTTALPSITDPVIIDGYTQPGALPNTSATAFNGTLLIELNGSGAGDTTEGLTITAGGSTVKGLVINRFAVNGILLKDQGGNRIEGNLIGTDPTGVVDLGNSRFAMGGSAGITASDGSNGNTIGGGVPAARNVISGNSLGIQLLSSGNAVAGNLIGVNALDNAVLANDVVGVQIIGSSNVIGTNGDGITDAAESNVICGTFTGVNIAFSTSSQNIVAGNYIGTNFAGAALGNEGYGVQDDGKNNVIGPGNTIAFNFGGVLLVGEAQKVAILGNSIYSNDNLGIDFEGDGVTPNDPLDADSGVNNLQNFPEISSATLDGATLRAQYVVPSTVNNSAYPLRIEFFKADADGEEGQTFLGFDTYTAADAGASKTFAFTSEAAVAVGQKLVATATDNNGNTSEFSANVTLQASACSTVVINTNDTGTGSLRSAITCANDTAGIDIVSFNIPGSGVQTISPVTVLPTITDPVIIDGYTQPGASANMNGLGLGDNAVLMIELNGANSGFVNGLNISSGGSTIEGLVINRFVVGILLFGSGDNVIEGNFLGTDATGTVGLGGGTVAIVGGANNTVGGATPKSRNVISANSYGIEIHSTGNVIQGNFIGTDVTGSVDLGSSNDGVLLDGSGNMIGGTAPGTRNIISGNDRWGIDVVGPGNLVQGNFIGTDVTGTLPLGNGTPGNPAAGIVLDSMLNTIGGTAAGQGNIIAFNAVNGVYVASGTGNSILSNSIFANTGLGIDLGPAAGVTANDPGDADTGPNNLQNFPVLFGAVASGNSTIVSGRLNSLPSTFFRIEFFANDDADSTGYGEGQTYLGFTNVFTTPAGFAVFQSPELPGIIPAGQYITATATRLSSQQAPVETSEFSFAMCSLIVTSTADSGIGSLRQAILCANDSPNEDHNLDNISDPDEITFAIPGSGVKTISPLSALPVITDPVIIDGYSQLGAVENSSAVGFTGSLLIELDGSQAPFSEGLVIEAGASVVRGLVINDFFSDGIHLRFGGGNLIEGNLIGTDPTGQIGAGNGFWGIVSGSDDNIIGGGTPASRNIISGSDVGVQLEGSRNIVAGNLIGVSASAKNALPNGTGIAIYGGSNIIGSNGDGIDDAGEANIIAGNRGRGVLFSDLPHLPGGTSQNVVAGNFIGTNFAGQALGNGQYGVFIDASNNRVGPGNTIAFNGSRFSGAGVAVSGQRTAVSNAIVGNSIFSNGDLGIDLNDDGFTDNDLTPPPDADTGPNNLQNFPVISAATINGAQLTLTYRVPSSPLNSTYPLRVEFFIADADGQEGKTFIGFDTYTATDFAAGNKTITFSPLSAVAGNDKLVATATDSIPTVRGDFIGPLGGTLTSPNNTSEFSASATVQVPSADLQITKTDGVTTVTPGDSLTYTIVVRNAGSFAATGAHVTDTFPASFMNDTFTAAGTGGASGFASGSGIINQTVNLPAGATITYTVMGTVSAGATGTLSNTATVIPPEVVTDPNSDNNSATDSDTIIPRGSVFLALGADAAARGQPAVSVYDASGIRLAKFMAYESNYRGGVRVALGDLNGDGVPEIITAPGRGHTPLVKAFTLLGIELPQFRIMAYAANFSGGVYVAVGDLLGDGPADIVVTPAREGKEVKGLKNGGAEVRVFQNHFNANPADPFQDTPDRKFLAFAPKTIGGVKFIGGATVATGDVQPGGKQEIIVGSGSGLRATVRAFNVENSVQQVGGWLSFDKKVRGGVFVSAGRIDGDSAADIVVSAGQNGNWLVEIRSGATGALLQAPIKPYAGTQQQVSPQSAVRVVAKDADGNGVIDKIVVGQGSDGRTHKIRQFAPFDSSAVDFLLENDPDFTGGFNLA